MQQQLKTEDTGFAPSFSCYSSDSITSRAVAKLISEEEVAQCRENGDLEGEDFTFALVLSNKEGLVNETDSWGSPSGTKCKTSSSTRSRRWIFRYLLQPNNECKEPMALLTPKKLQQKRNSGVVSADEQLYVQKRAENEVGKRRSYLPYRKDLVGLFAHDNGMGKMLLF